MRIALLHYAAPPVVGGVETVIYHHARLFNKFGHQVRIIAGRGQTWDLRIPVNIDSRFDSRHPEVIKFKKELDSGIIPPGFNHWVEELYLALQQLLEEIDIVIIHNVASLHKNLGLTAALYRMTQSSYKQRFILWHHDLAWQMPGYHSELYPGWPWDLLRKSWPGVEQVAISEARRQDLCELFGIQPETVKVIPAGLDLAEFYSLQPDVIKLVERFGLTEAAPILLAPVRLTRRKNLELAICTTASLRMVMPSVVLIITGPTGAHNPANGEYLHQLNDLCEELDVENSVHLLANDFPDGLTSGQMAEVYRLADALILPSREEGFGIPILEAGLGRLPVFCSDLSSLRALAEDSATYFSPDDPPEKLAERIAAQLEGDASYRFRARVRTRYSWEGIFWELILPLVEEI
jgi:mannosylglucosylglycerate synthase